MTLTQVLDTAATSAAVALLIELAAYVQAKTTSHGTQPCQATRHATRSRPRDAGEFVEYPGRTQTAGAPIVPPTPSAPAPHITRHAAEPATWWADPSWPDTADDTHVTQTVT